jgi:hypothetical protein
VFDRKILARIICGATWRASDILEKKVLPENRGGAGGVSGLEGRD